ncbi:MAG TPA: heme o synthase [Candidatus Binataceae bacterium]|jgi:protoheme IX farnesyltransferase
MSNRAAGLATIEESPLLAENEAANTPLATRGRGLGLVRDYYELAKPRVVSMVLVTTAAGYYLGSGQNLNLRGLIDLLIGTTLCASGTLALNQFIERDLDALMNRTRQRPLPSGRLSAREALIFGLAAAVAGLLYLWATTNALAAGVTAAITIVYLAVYTPMKRWTSACSIVGAIPGALPPVAGWAAARGALGLEPAVLFAIMYLWQLPHSLAIAHLYRYDYARAGIRLLPTVDPTGRSTMRQIVINSFALLAVGMLPTVLGLAGAPYFLVSTVLGILMVGAGLKLSFEPQSAAAARRLMFASLVYLPGVLAMMVIDKV